MSYKCSRCEFESIPDNRDTIRHRDDTVVLMCWQCTSNTKHVPVPGEHDV